MPPGHCLGALDMLSRNLQFPHSVPFTKEKMPWCPCPLQNKVYRPDIWMGPKKKQLIYSKEYFICVKEYFICVNKILIYFITKEKV